MITNIFTILSKKHMITYTTIGVIGLILTFALAYGFQSMTLSESIPSETQLETCIHIARQQSMCDIPKNLDKASKEIETCQQNIELKREELYTCLQNTIDLNSEEVKRLESVYEALQNVVSLQSDDTEEIVVSEEEIVSQETKQTTMYRNQVINPLPHIAGNTASKRFNNLVSYYGYDPQWFINARIQYGIKEEVIACVIRADTGFTNLKTPNNPGNVGNTDSGATRGFASMEQGINAIAQTMTNKYLGNYSMIGEYSNGGRNILGLGHGHIYASSQHNWNANVLDCLSFIYGKRIDEDFIVSKIRRYKQNTK